MGEISPKKISKLWFHFLYLFQQRSIMCLPTCVLYVTWPPLRNYKYRQQTRPRPRASFKSTMKQINILSNSKTRGGFFTDIHLREESFVTNGISSDKGDNYWLITPGHNWAVWVHLDPPWPDYRGLWAFPCCFPNTHSRWLQLYGNYQSASC